MVLCAVGQLCSRGNVVENLIRCQSIISRSAKAGAKIVFLPEASDYIAPASQSPSLAQPLKDSQFVQGIQASAQQNNCWVSVGVHEKSTDDPNRCHNTSLIISNDGILQQAYRKLHLFDIDLGNSTSANESKYIIPGKTIEEPVPTPIGHAQVGTHIDKPLRQSWGHAMVIDPWGTVLAQVPDLVPSLPPPSIEDNPQWSTSFALADIDLSSLEHLRKSMPILNQRRDDIYPRLE
ncbi:hypothetical protein PTTG_03039 [Puccinia triticina 1-1 BBBD Race 1]|uniref:CN hydrolase domain-containing protein n=1 Tax=Puccinia triticina (isolate 1-1 / race 1 (BBBD)) TaxID=630390 RepID=A0A0C4EQI0_PUCT1|nr:hypothetical protein PTTG_03039 [Puccinia triticina 1-1 BBBD Race 1]WAR61716.1 hypothetical protein PtB15_12B406 [Puccinia triticina]